MRPYLDFMRHVYEHGTTKTDRTGTGTRSVFGYQMRFDLQQGFPLVTTKKLHLTSIVPELMPVNIPTEVLDLVFSRLNQYPIFERKRCIDLG